MILPLGSRMASISGPRSKYLCWTEGTVTFSAGIAFKEHVHNFLIIPPTGDGPGYNMKKRSSHIFRLFVILGIIIISSEPPPQKRFSRAEEY
jgi:hypothetical protein